jgi:hypothetical protein
LAQALPFSGIAIYEVDASGTALRCAFSDGKGSKGVRRSTMQLGERLSGWVGANRTAVWNSDAALDMGVAEAAAEGVRLCSGIPLVLGDDLIGVVAFYGTHDQEFSLGHRYLLESIAPVMCSGIAVALQRSACIDAQPPSSRKAVLAVLEGALAHRIAGPAGLLVRLVYLKPRVDSRRGEVAQASQYLQSVMVAKFSSSTKILKTSVASFLVVNQGTDVNVLEFAATLEEIMSAARKALSGSHVDVQQVAIDSPIQLHEAMRHLDPADSAPTSSKSLH